MVPPIPELLAELVRRPSINPMGRTDLPPEQCHERRVTDYLEACVKSLGVPYRRHEVAPGRDNLVAEFRPAKARMHFLWEAHQDTVPVDGMTIDPFAGAIRDGRLYGRGACDVKAGIACMLSAFARLVTEQPRHAAAVTLAFTIDEEHTFLGVQHLMKLGITADFAIVAEPTGLDIVTAHKGVARWAIETAGVACHSSRPEKGENAIYRMGVLLTAIERFASSLAQSRRDDRLGPATLSVGQIQGGVSPNTVPDQCRIELDRRLLPGETAGQAMAELEAYLRSNCPDVPFVTSTPRLACPALPECTFAAGLDRLGRAINQVSGRHSRVAVPYGTDASTIAEQGIPAVVFGPGDIAQAHTKDEWVELREVEAAADILYRLAISPE